MQKIKATIAVPESGPPKVLYLGFDAGEAIKALEDAKGTIDGEVLVIRNPVATRRWKGKADKPAPAAVPAKRGRPRKIT